MANVNDLCIAVLGALEAGLAGVDYVSSTSYMPAIQTHTVSLVGVAQGQADDGMFYSEGWLHGVHRLRFEFWVKLVQGKENVYMALARNIGYDAMKVLVRENGNGYLLASMGSGVTLQSQVEERPIAAGGQPYLVVMLTVPVMQKETV
jgi:hypothetical protein